MCEFDPCVTPRALILRVRAAQRGPKGFSRLKTDQGFSNNNNNTFYLEAPFRARKDTLQNRLIKITQLVKKQVKNTKNQHNKNRQLSFRGSRQSGTGGF